MTAPRAFLRPERRFLLASGADAVAWWQGQTTNEMRVAPGEPVAFCLVEATGQLRAVVDGMRIEENPSPFKERLGEVEHPAFIFVTEHPEILLQRVNEYVILEDVRIEVLDGVVATILTDTPPEGMLAVPVPGGCDVLLPKDHTLELEDEETLLSRRLAQGIPQIGLDTSDKTLPPELGTWFEKRYIHYAKGCYMGQEVLQRIHSRGHVNRQWHVLRVAEAVPVASPVTDENGERVGAVTQCNHHPEDGWLVGAFLKRGAESRALSIQGNVAQFLL